MREPRLYLYRKAGRSVWDAELLLPDGRRRTWRTGTTDRSEAERLAQERLEETTAVLKLKQLRQKMAAV